MDLVRIVRALALGAVVGVIVYVLSVAAGSDVLWPGTVFGAALGVSSGLDFWEGRK
jgi:hypothetical protein